MKRWGQAPGRPRGGRSGACFCWLILLALLAACGGERGSRADQRHRLPLGKDTLDLGAAVNVVDVRLGGPDTSGAIHPGAVRARVGDVVRFVAADARGNAVAFDEGALAPDARAFLARTRQLRGPPLISVGASWVVSLQGAPPGRYPFHSLTRGSAGVLVVEPRPPER